MIDVLVIGCGASGITAAIKAKNLKNRVVILERNEKPLKNEDKTLSLRPTSGWKLHFYPKDKNLTLQELHFH